MHSVELVNEINSSLSLQLPPTLDEAGLQAMLAEHINYLILHDFQKLIFVLYRVDVSETKLKSVLHQHAGADAGKIIAALLIERQVQKMEAKLRFRDRQQPESDEERW